MSIFNLSATPATGIQSAKAASTLRGVKIEWELTDELSSNNYFGAGVYRSETNDFNTSTPIGTSKITNSMLDPNATAGVTYYYWIKTLDSFGNDNGPLFPEVTEVTVDLVEAQDVNPNVFPETSDFISTNEIVFPNVTAAASLGNSTDTQSTVVDDTIVAIVTGKGGEIKVEGTLRLSASPIFTHSVGQGESGYGQHSARMTVYEESIPGSGTFSVVVVQSSWDIYYKESVDYPIGGSKTTTLNANKDFIQLLTIEGEEDRDYSVVIDVQVKAQSKSSTGSASSTIKDGTSIYRRVFADVRAV